MKRLFLHLIVGLLTFALGNFLFAASESYNATVARGEAEKREKADYSAPLRQRLSASRIESAMRILGCVDNTAVTCVYAIVEYEAWPEACGEYRRLLAELEQAEAQANHLNPAR